MIKDFEIKDDEDEISTIIDGDTEEDNTTGLRRRLSGGVDTREVAVIKEDKYGNEVFIPPEVGAYLQKDAYRQLIEEGDFNYRVDSGEYGYYDRELYDRLDPEGNKISETMIATGIVDPNIYTPPEAIQAREDYLLEEQLSGKRGEYSDIADNINQTIRNAGVDYKRTALNETVFNPELHSGVAFRDHERTIDNQGRGITGQMGDAWDAGWIGVREGMYGYLEGIGVVTESELIESIGTRGVLRARDQLRKAPQGVIDYKEVDGLYNGFRYVMNNAAMSAPYMVTTFGSIAAAIPATFIGGPVLGGLTFYLPNSVIYGGHAWNEMEGDKGAEQFAAATTIGVAASVLDRFALGKVLAPTQFLSKQGVRTAATQMVARNKQMTIETAEAMLRSATRDEQKKLVKYLGELKPDDLAKFSGLQVAQRGVAGAAVESATEMAQEGLQYGGAVAFSDKEYNANQLYDRLINAGIAGGVLGGGIGAAGNIYTQGKQEVYRTAKAPGDQDRFRIMNQHKMNVMTREGEVKSIDQNIDEKTAAQNRSRKANSSISDTERARAQVGALTDAQLEAIVEGDFESEQGGRRSQNNVDKIKDELAELNDQLDDAKAKGANTTPIEKEIAKKEGELRRATKLRENARLELANRKKGLPPLSLEESDNIKARIEQAAMEAPNNIEGVFANSASKWIEIGRGTKNFIKNIDGLSDFVNKVGLGLTRLVQAAERSAIEMSKLVQDTSLLDLFARVGQLTTGVYHAGVNFKQYYDTLLESYRLFIDEGYLIKRLYNSTINKDNVLQASDEIRGFANTADAPNGSAFQQYISWLQIKDSGITWEQFYKPSEKQLAYTEEKAQILYEASISIKTSYEALLNGTVGTDGKTRIPGINETLLNEDPNAEPYVLDPDFWWKSRGFDWHTIKRNKSAFKKWLRENNFSEREAEILYQNIAYRGEANYVEDYSLVGGTAWYPPFLSRQILALSEVDGFDNFSSRNIFEPLNRAQIDAAKYVSTTKYFGHGGRKIDFLISEALRAHANADPKDKSALQIQDILQFSFYMKAIIDSTHGNFNTIESPKWAAVNRFLTSWSIFAGLPLSTLSSIPETAMVYYGLQDDSDWQMANKNLINQLSGAWDKALSEELERVSKLTTRAGVAMNMNTVADRVSTGQRDIAFVKAHEVFFTFIGIKNFTQFQRRMNAAMAIDFVKSRTEILVTAPLLKSLFKMSDLIEDASDTIIDTDEIDVRFDFGSMNNEELQAYNDLTDLGLDVERMVTIMRDTEELYRDNIFLPTNTRIEDNDYITTPSPKQAAVLSAFKNSKNGRGTEDQKEIIAKAQELENEINEYLETAVYRFVNERIQNPQAANRPLFFQDPHYQLLTQFNGFISTFTAVVVPKLWNNYLRKGNPQMKYNTFALIVVMIALGGASQYIKDFLKFGGPSPYLDATGYTQRAVYASGVLGQYERVVDAMSPLYPDRSSNWLMGTIVSETGPSVRNVLNLGEAVGMGIEGGKGDLAISKALGTAPLIAPFTGARQMAGKAATGQDPLKGTSIDGSTVESLVSKLFN